MANVAEVCCPITVTERDVNSTHVSVSGQVIRTVTLNVVGRIQFRNRGPMFKAWPHHPHSEHLC